jgi:uncharacterized protein (DUF433 family)
VEWDYITLVQSSGYYSNFPSHSDNTRIPVWSLAHDRQLGMSDARILKALPALTAADLVNAWAYAEAYPNEIEIAIQENDAVLLEEVG